MRNQPTLTDTQFWVRRVPCRRRALTLQQYANVVDAYLPYLDQSGGVVGTGPYREVQLWIDDRLAGAAYPFPVIFTGGIVLTWWRSVSSFDDTQMLTGAGRCALTGRLISRRTRST